MHIDLNLKLSVNSLRTRFLKSRGLQAVIMSKLCDAIVTTNYKSLCQVSQRYC